MNDPEQFLERAVTPRSSGSVGAVQRLVERRRRRRRVAGGAGALALVVAGFGVAGMLRDEDDAKVDVVNPPSTVPASIEPIENPVGADGVEEHATRSTWKPPTCRVFSTVRTTTTPGFPTATRPPART
ncbi:MAG: hypothetical protein R2695_13915 [Acidimicrobiales bacterium]